VTGFAAGVLGLALALGGLAGGCADSKTSPPGSDDVGSGSGTTLPELPPIDLSAPSDFATASFALG